MAEAETIDTADDDSVLLPAWLTPLRALAGASVLGVSLTDDPVGFVQAALTVWLLDGAMSVIGQVALAIRAMFRELTDVLVAVGAALGLPFVVVADVVEAAIAGSVDAITALAASAGPFGPLILFALGGVLVVALAVAARVTIAVLRRAIPWVIPWI